jgi:hypothetical protein
VHRYQFRVFIGTYFEPFVLYLDLLLKLYMCELIILQDARCLFLFSAAAWWNSTLVMLEETICNNETTRVSSWVWRYRVHRTWDVFCTRELLTSCRRWFLALDDWVKFIIPLLVTIFLHDILFYSRTYNFVSCTSSLTKSIASVSLFTCGYYISNGFINLIFLDVQNLVVN